MQNLLPLKITGLVPFSVLFLTSFLCLFSQAVAFPLWLSCYAADLDAIFRGQKGGEGVEKSKLLLLIRSSHAGRCQYGVGKSPHSTPWGRKGNACNLRSGFCCQEGKGTAPERELRVGSERAASPCEVLVLLVPAAVSHVCQKLRGRW